MEKPKVKLIGEDGNAFAILTRARKAALKAGWTMEQVGKFSTEATSGNYDHLLAVVQKYFDVY